MKILITTPDFSRHGGIRVIIEWANHLLNIFGHDVTMYTPKPCERPDWIRLDPKVKLISRELMTGYDCLIITSPHTIDLQNHPNRPKKVFVFLQMMEHLFRPNDAEWKAKCVQLYQSPYPLFSISKWNIEMMQNEFGRTGPTHYIKNGVNTYDFLISRKPKDGKTVLIEGWECSNPSKDIKNIAPLVAKFLRKQGYRILAYSGKPLKTLPQVPHRYYFRPDTEKINELYEQATILIKASLFDARACAPMEAMTKGTVTVRAINYGDDDLVNEYNCLKSIYRYSELLKNSIRLLQNEELRLQLAANGFDYLESLKWEDVLKQANEIICK